MLEDVIEEVNEPSSWVSRLVSSKIVVIYVK